MLAKVPDSMLDLLIEIDSVTPYPGNPRRGDIDAIAESLDSLTQYRPIVVDRATNHVLAGNHTRYAALKLGWTHIAAVFVDATPEQAKRIVLADNRLGDIGEMDLEALLDLLEMDESNLEVTGYTEQEVQRLASQLRNESLFDSPLRESVGNEADLSEGEDASLQVGPYRFTVDQERFIEWADVVEGEVDEDNREKDIVRERLGLQGAEPLVYRKNRKKKIDRSPGDQLGDVAELNIAIGTLKLYPDNARRGDISAIAESMKINGQYRPIVVSARTLHVLSGNHTYLAALALGWSEIAAVLIDVDLETERLIVLADNKLAQRASYNMEELSVLLEDVADNPAGTGFTMEDISEILGKADAEAEKNRRIWVAIRHRPTETNIRVACSLHGFESWLADLREKVGSDDDAVKIEILNRLEM